MTRAGFCAECGANVYVNDDGSCANGHAAASVGGIYETGAAPASPAAPPNAAFTMPVTGVLAGPPPKKRHTVLIVVASLAVGLLLVCVTLGVVLTIGGRALQSSYTDNMGRALCFSNQQDFEGETQMWIVAKQGRQLTDLGKTFEEVTTALVAEGLTNKAPTCRDGGVYTWEPVEDGKSGLLRCSIHGHYTDPVE